MRKPGPRGRGSRAQPNLSPQGQSPLFYPPLFAGTFRDKLTIQKQVLVPNDSGGFGGGVWASDEGWEDVKTVWARIQSINPTAFVDEKQWRDKQFLYQQWFAITLRYGAPLDTNMRLLYKGTRKFIIYSIVDRDLLRWETNLFCREGG